jgi:hypothetical protein
MKKLLIATAVSLFALTACDKTPPEPTPQEKQKAVAEMQARVEAAREARSVSLENALFNANSYRAANPRFLEGDWRIVPHADVAISVDCPQGSGWADLSLMKVVGKDVEKVTLICSTYDLSLGCYRKEDFVKKPFGAEEGKCQPAEKVQYPLKKMTR